PQIASKEVHHQVVGLEDRMQHRHGKHLHLLGMALQQNLGEDRPGQVLAGPAVANLDLLAPEDEVFQVLKRDVTPRLAIVQPAIGIALDGDDFRSRSAHGSLPLERLLAGSSTCCLADVSSAHTGSSWFHALHHVFIVGRTMMQLQYRLVVRSRQAYQFPGAYRLLALCCKCSISALTRLFLAASIER